MPSTQFAGKETIVPATPPKNDDATQRSREASEPVSVRPVPPVATETLPEISPAVASTPPADGEGPVRVALLLPLSGTEQSLGQALLDAALIALFEIGDTRLTLLPRDTQGTPEGARAAATAVLREGVQLMLGPVFSASVAARRRNRRGSEA